MKKICICIAILLIIVAFLVVMFIRNSHDDAEVLASLNDEEYITFENDVLRIKESREYKDLTVSNFEVEMLSNKSCEIRASVFNNSDEIVERQDVALELYSKDGELIGLLGAQIDSIHPGESTILYAHCRRNSIEDIYRIEIKPN